MIICRLADGNSNFYLGHHLCSVLSSILDFFFPSTTCIESLLCTRRMSTLLHSRACILEAHSPTKRHTIKCLKYSATKFTISACKGRETGNHGWKVVSACHAGAGGEGPQKRKAMEREYEPHSGNGTEDTLLRWLCLFLFVFNVLEGSSSRSW